MQSSDRLARAQAALDKVLMQPASARADAEVLLAEGKDDEAAAIALRAIGLTWKENGELGRATRSLRQAIRVAEKVAVPYRAAEARMSLVVILADRGQTDAALAEAALASSILVGVDHARLKANLGLVLARTGRRAEARSAFDESKPVLRAEGDSRWEALVLNMSGILYTYSGELSEATTDFLRAEQLTEDNGYHLLNAIVQTNLSWVARQSGDIPAALRRLDTAANLYAKHGKRGTNQLVDKADMLLVAGLAGEARSAVSAAIAEAETGGFRYNLAESHLMHARAALADHDPAASAQAARKARAMFGRQRRATWADLARQVEVAARFAQGERSAALLREASAVADRLQAAGWPVAPYEARLLAGRIARKLGRTEEAQALLADVARHRTRGAAEIRTLAWHAHALHALTAGRTVAAERALQAGLRVHAENNAVLGATDLRAHASVHGEELATMGLRLAFDRNDTRAVLRWAETWRAASLRRRPVRPPDDEQLADDLAALRRAVAEIAAAETPTRGASRAETSRLHAERLRLEEAIRDRSRTARGTYAAEPPFSPTALAAALGDRVLVEFIRLDGELHVVTVADGAVRRHRLGSYPDVLRALEMVRFTMNRMSRRFGSPAIQAAAVQAYDHSRAVLDELLLAPIRSVLDGGGRRGSAGGRRELVIVPTGSLHAMPWTVLPTCSDRPVSVTPSARLWLASAQQALGVGAGAGMGSGSASASGSGSGAGSGSGFGSGFGSGAGSGAGSGSGSGAGVATGSDAGVGATRRTVLMAGPGLAHAEPEIDALAARYPDARVLTGPAATATDVAAALDGAALAHVATHGRFRSDHPLFSSLDMADGPLYVYDLERLGSTPDLLILSACESALSGVRPGDELMGLASAVFALGTRALIASVTPVNDADTRTLMLALHANLAAGRPPAAALSEASVSTGIGGFVCFGFGS